ncbi:MAG TPA: hypothetical protein VJW73_03965 [Gemmatimonadaceae bacterium]|nr:hypothetical protein [Gemmatimonadaceae bacterium]
MPRSIALIALLVVATTARAQNDAYADMHWREIGPTRAGRARAVAGVPSQPNVAYIGFDNGGVWRSTDYGSTWHPLFDHETTGSIGAIAVAPSDPNIIYVGSGAGIIRPDLATGNGMYKSTDGGRTWVNLGLHDTQMIAMIAVDPRDPNRVFVAALGHPYGPNEERGIFRSTDGGRTFQKVLYKDEYTSANDVKIDPSDPNIVYAALWQQQQSFIEGGSFGGSNGGIFKSTDGGTTWQQLSDGLPTVLQANLAIAPSDPKTLYATIAGAAPGAPAAPVGFGGGVIGFYKSTDAGAHWTLVNGAGVTGREPDNRPLGRIGGGDLPELAVDSKNPNVVYTCSTVFWRTEDGGITWSAVRGAPGGDDYQQLWINPNDPNILILVSDQGGVVSANRGASWSNWYTQPTAAMYHVSTDNTFVYRVCGGQQDSGSACVASRSMDGEITFHDWHPVNIQEYGIAAPDPRDADMVYGSERQGVSLYNRRTGQTTQVGPDLTEKLPQGGAANRNVRTMPIAWSRLDPTVLYYVSNVVWKSTDHAHRWTRISPDLTRQTWAVPANAGKYASGVTPAPLGSITALSPSPRKMNILWAGTDDGAIQTTSDGGRTWTNVTPPAIKPWTRIFNIEAGHFDDRTAYAAANTMRVDDMNPHLWRTHDGGRTWTEINTGIAPGAVTNSIREDPRKPGLLYASTDTQVWVSFDDGGHWESLRLNMPAISVRDLELKDDSTCLCADLIAGTHGRGFWILDNVTPLRQEAEARAAKTAYLFKPNTAVRVRFATNDPTPWPPELPAGENPLPGGIIDYYLPNDASGEVKLEILENGGKVVRSYSSNDPVLRPHPALDSAAYNRVCQQNPNAPFCPLPLYWPGPPMVISTQRGMHRVWWDLRFNPVTVGDTMPNSDDDATGAVPHRTYALVNAPWVPPGNYTVRLTVNGQQLTQPLVLRLDPRVRTPAAGLAQLATLSRDLYDRAVATHAAYLQARTLASSSANSALRAQLDSLAPPARGGGRRGGFGRRGAAANATPTLNGASDALLAAAMAMQSADVTPTAAQVAAADRARAQANAAMARWNALRSSAASRGR